MNATVRPLAVVSPIALAVGILGLIPFLALTGLAWRAPHGHTTWPFDLLYGYAAVILSFIGAVHWGAALQQANAPPFLLLWSVLPALMGWSALGLPYAAGSIALVVAFVLCWMVDLRLTWVGYLPRWYMNLRHGLTVVVILCLVATWPLVNPALGRHFIPAHDFIQSPHSPQGKHPQWVQELMTPGIEV